MHLRFFVLLVLTAFIYSGCDVSSSNSGSTNLQVTAEPKEGGSVSSSGNQLRAKPNRGYIFQYWQVNYSDGTINTLTDDSVTVQNESVEDVKGVFGTTEVEIPLHLKVGPNGRYAYFVNDFIMPVDTSRSTIVYAFVKADVRTLEKQKIYTTEKRIKFFDISYDGNFIAFSHYNNDNYDTYVLDVNQQDIDIYGIGVRPVFSNNSYDFLTVWDNGACIQTLYRNSCRGLDVSSEATSIPSKYWAASWSPDDQMIAFSNSKNNFFLFNTETIKGQTAASNTGKEYFKWLDNSTFITSGASQNNKLGVSKYSVDELNSPQSLPFSTVFEPSVSPSNSRLAYINQGVNIFSREDSLSSNILNYVEWDPLFPQWLDENNILFYDRNSSQPFILRTSGEVVQL